MSPLPTVPRDLTFENIVGKGENTFSPFPAMFSTQSKTNFCILVTCK